MLPQFRFARLDAPIVLAHGLFGFTRIGVGRVTLTSYFRGIPQALEAAGNRVLVTRVPPIAGVEQRARRLGEQIEQAFGDEPVHLIGHSMGGLDARRLLADPNLATDAFSALRPSARRTWGRRLPTSPSCEWGESTAC